MKKYVIILIMFLLTLADLFSKESGEYIDVAPEYPYSDDSNGYWMKNEPVLLLNEIIDLKYDVASHQISYFFNPDSLPIWNKLENLQFEQSITGWLPNFKTEIPVSQKEYKMNIFTPDDSKDYKMKIFTPDDSKDYKMQIYNLDNNQIKIKKLKPKNPFWILPEKEK